MLRITALRHCRRWREASSELSQLLDAVHLPFDNNQDNDEDEDDNDEEDDEGKDGRLVRSVLSSRPGSGRGHQLSSDSPGSKEDEEDEEEEEEEEEEEVKSTARTSGGKNTSRSTTSTSSPSTPISTPNDGSTSVFIEFKYEEADPFELQYSKEEEEAAAGTAAKPSNRNGLHRPLLRNDVHLLHADNVRAVSWILDLHAKDHRPTRRLRTAMGRARCRKLHLIRLQLLMDLLAQQPTTGKTTGETTGESTTIAQLYATIEEELCALDDGMRTGTSLGTWVPPAPPPPPPTPPPSPSTR